MCRAASATAAAAAAARHTAAAAAPCAWDVSPGRRRVPRGGVLGALFLFHFLLCAREPVLLLPFFISFIHLPSSESVQSSPSVKISIRVYGGC